MKMRYCSWPLQIRFCAKHPFRLSPAVHVTLAINELPVQRNMKGVTTASNNVDCIWQSPAFDITARELCALIANGESVEVLKEKWHDSEQRLVKIYELRAKDIVRLLPSWVRRQSAKLPDLVIKTFKASDCNQQANQAACWELAALKKLRRLSCEHTPTLTHTFSFIQDDSRVVAVVMQKIKGITLSDAWESMSARTKTKVRKAFKIARQYVFSITPVDFLFILTANHLVHRAVADCGIYKVAQPFVTSRTTPRRTNGKKRSLDRSCSSLTQILSS